MGFLKLNVENSVVSNSVLPLHLKKLAVGPLLFIHARAGTPTMSRKRRYTAQSNRVPWYFSFDRFSDLKLLFLANRRFKFFLAANYLVQPTIQMTERRGLMPLDADGC